MPVHSRASTPENFGRPASAPATRMKMWPSDGQKGFKPIVFKPNGSFRGVSQYENAFKRTNKVKKVDRLGSKKQFIPGYTGFIRGSQHVQGRTFGQATKTALRTNYRDMACSSPIPPGPQNKRDVAQYRPKSSIISDQSTGKAYHLPGYTGHIPGKKQSWGHSFGGLSAKTLARNAKRFGRTAPDANSPYAFVQRQKTSHVLTSHPLPGGQPSTKPPIMMIPSHLKFLRYYDY
jgi:hypothetical protein